MNSKNLWQTRQAITKIEVILLIAVIITAAVIGGVLLIGYNRNTALSSSPTTGTADSGSNPSPTPTVNSELNPSPNPSANPSPSPSPTPEIANPEENSSELPVTTDYSVFQPVADFGNGTWQFEENNQHVYNYSWSGAVATFNMSVGAMVIVPPTLDDGLLLVDLSNTSMTPASGGVAAINMQTGQLVWETSVPNMMMSQPITYEGLVIIGLGTGTFQNDTVAIRGTGTNYVAALNFSTGQTVWTFETLGEDMPTPVIYNGLVVFPNGNGEVYALDALTGGEVWNISLPVGAVVSMSSPALVGNMLYFGVNVVNGYQYDFDCVNLTGKYVVWSTPTNGMGGLDDCSPVVWNGVVISGYTAATSSGLLQPVLFGMNATNGEILWQVNENSGPQPSGGEWFAPVTVYNGVVYSDSAESGMLYAVDASTGAQLWSISTGKATCNVNVFDGNLWIVNSSGTLFVLDPSTGAVLSSTDVGLGLVDGSLLFVGQNVIIWGNGQVMSMPVSDFYSGS